MLSLEATETQPACGRALKPLTCSSASRPPHAESKFFVFVEVFRAAPIATGDFPRQSVKTISSGVRSFLATLSQSVVSGRVSDISGPSHRAAELRSRDSRHPCRDSYPSLPA